MNYPKSKNPKPVYFLLLKLYNVSDGGILSRNFYWLHLSGGDYKLLEPYRKSKVSLKITSQTFIRGSTYELQMHVENKSKNPNTKSLLLKNNFIEREHDSDFDMASLGVVHTKERKQGLLKRIHKHFMGEGSKLRVDEINGAADGVAFFLHFSVHSSKEVHKKGEDTRILPVHYSDNYFSLVPGEMMPITISFEVPEGVTPQVLLRGWNYLGDHTVHLAV